MEKDEYFEVLNNELLRGELELAIEIEQAETLDDLMRRRICFELSPGHGLEVLPEVLTVLKELKPNLDLAAEEQKYREKISKLNKLIND